MVLLAQTERDSQRALAPARTWAVCKSEHSSTGSANDMDLSSGSGASQPGALASLATVATNAYMNVLAIYI